ncbi:hypothetical protein HKCCD6035_02345 [Rhodobacterales bacterium HKCCD6035]|nr:hypothetical protein [Rhodobacterales bacterium HKCCD6035]
MNEKKSKKLIQEYLRSLDFPVNQKYGREEIKKSQTALLEMALIVCSILEKYDIPYVITNGTLIGAALYEIFVPWDDDFDLFLFDDTYDQAMELLNAELPEHLLVHGEQNDSRYFPAWNRVKNLNTIVKDSGLYNSDNRFLKYPCLSLDLYRFKKIKNSEVVLYKINEAMAFFSRKFQSGIIDIETYQSQIQKLNAQKNNFKKLRSEDIGIDNHDVFMFMVMLNKPLKYNELFPLKRYLFEGHCFWGPSSSHALLSSLYGPNYKKIPEYSERKSRLSEVHWIGS